jgi:hypothetical protein
MNEYQKETFIAIGGSLAFVVIFFTALIGEGGLNYTQRTNNFQQTLKTVTECRVQAKASADAICGEVPTWEQYK